MLKRFIIIFSILILISGCLGSKSKNIKKRSANIDTAQTNAEINFPDSQYLTAKATGASEAEAKKNAKAEISSIFEAKISSDLTSSTTQITGTKKKGAFSKTVKNNIRIQSYVELKGLEIGAAWKQGSTYFAVAVLEKNKAAKQWLSEIDIIDNQIDAELNGVKIAKSKVQKLKPLKKILSLWLKKKGIISRLRIIGNSNSGAANYDIKDIFKQIAKIKSQIRFYITIKGKYSNDAKKIIAKNLGQLGFIITDNISKANVKISGTISTSLVKNNNKDFVFSRSKISLSIIDTFDGSQLNEINENSRKSALNYNEASYKAVKSACFKSSEKLLEYFD